MTITIGEKPLFTPHFTLHFTICKANIVTDSHIRSQFLHDAITECVGSFATIVFSLRHTSYHAQSCANVLFGQLPHLRICQKTHFSHILMAGVVKLCVGKAQVILLSDISRFRGRSRRCIRGPDGCGISRIPLWPCQWPRRAIRCLCRQGCCGGC